MPPGEEGTSDIDRSVGTRGKGREQAWWRGGRRQVSGQEGPPLHDASDEEVL